MVELGKKTVRAWTRFLRAHARLVDAAETAFKQAGLPPLDWYKALDKLERGPLEGMRPFELEAATGAAQYNVSRLVERMTRAGLVERVACPDDRRGWRIVLTQSGRAMRANMWDVYSQTIAHAFADRLSDKKIRQLDEIMGELVDRKSKAGRLTPPAKP